MSQERKRLLIVDDTEIDRIILKSILSTEFDIMEANSGNMAIEYVTERRDMLDAVLLDISMPHIDGFDVLKFMRDKEITDIPVFLVTAEPTMDNVQRAIEYSNVEEFISKPFDKNDILRRMHSRLGVLPKYDLQSIQLTETWKFITELEALYKHYLSINGKDDEAYRVMVDLMDIMLNQYNRNARKEKLEKENIRLISKAAYFCDIGEMLVPDKRLMMFNGQSQQDMYADHTWLGASIVRLNSSEKCKYFVEICSNMCLHHHERFDGTGYPSKMKNSSIFDQMCSLADNLYQLQSKFYGDRSKPVSFVIRRLVNDEGMVSPEIRSLLEDCEKQIIDYFVRKKT